MLFLFPLAFIAMWLIVMTVVRKAGGMSTGLSQNLGDPLRSSSWGSASINAATFRGCIKVQEYGDGYIARAMWLFGNGEIWLPKGSTQIGDMKPGVWWRLRSRRLSCGDRQIVLYGKLADFIEVNESSKAP